MKRKYILFIVVVIFVLIIAIILLGHLFIGHALKVSISKKTNQNITLNIGNVDYSLLNSSVAFTNSVFVFNNTYVNKEKTIRISELKFDEIKIEDLSVFRLIFHREFIAKKLEIRRPSIWFSENDNPIHFKEKPKEIVAGLKNKKDLLGNLVVIVDEFVITDGIIDMKQIIDSEEHKGSVEFQLLLKDFNTSKENIVDEDRLLFAEKHFVKLSNFRYFLPNGDIISFDSTVFETVSNSLLAYNINIEVVSGSVNPKFKSISADINKLIIGGIDLNELESMHDINIDSIGVSDVYLNFVNNDSFSPMPASDTSKHKLDLFKVIKSSNLGSLALNNINLLNQTAEGDTVIDLENLKLNVRNIKFDSALLAVGMPEIDYSSIVISSGKVKVFEEESGLKLNLSNSNFNEENKVLSLAGLRIDDQKPLGSKKLQGEINFIELLGISVEDLVAGQKVKVGISITDPIFKMDINADHLKKRHKKINGFDKFEITEVQISDGVFHLFEDDKLDVVVSGFYVNSGKINLSNFSKINEINTNNLKLNTSKVKISIPDKDVKVEFRSMSVINNTITFNTILGNYKDVGKSKSSIEINQLQLGGVNINKFLSENEIDLKHLKIIKPQLAGNIKIDSDKYDTVKKKPSHKFDYIVDIAEFEIIDGEIDLNTELEKKVLRFKTGINIEVDKINIGGSEDTAWLNRLLWKVNLSKSELVYQDYQINCMNIISDNNKDILVLKDITIKDNESSRTKNGFDIVDLSINSVNLLGIEYNSIIDKKTPVVRSVSINKPHLDIRIDSRKPRPKTNPKKKNNRAIPLDINELEISNLSFIIEKYDNISTSNFSLSKLDFSYDMTSTDNIVGGLNNFRASNFLFSDSIKNSYASIKELSFDKEDIKITFSEISGGSIDKHQVGENILSYASSGFDIEGIDITKESPHSININEVNIVDLNLDIEDHKAKKKLSGSSSKDQLKLPSFINSFEVDEISASNIDLTHRTVTDSSDKKLILNNIGFDIGFLKVDSSTFSNNKYEFAKNMSISLKGNKIISSDSLYETSVDGINYDFTKNTLEIDSLMMKPRFKSAEFFKKAIYQTGEMDVVTGKIECRDVRLNKLIAKGDIHMGNVDVFGLDMRIFRNKKYEMDPNLYKKMPQEALLGMTRLLTIDSLKTFNAYIQYRQLSKKSVVPGEIFLNKVNLSVMNINNDLKVIDHNSNMLVLFNGKLIGESDINLKMTFPILSPSHDFYVTGHVDKIDFSKLNAMTQNLVGVSLTRGTGELDIPLIRGNDKYSMGSILFKYKKLKVELYDRDKAENASGLGGNMANLLLNDIIIKSNNPGFLGKTRPGEVYFKRNTQKSVVFYTWKSILSGIMSTMGYNNKEQRQEKKTLKRKNRKKLKQ